MSYYRATFFVVGLLLASAIGLYLTASFWHREKRDKFSDLSERAMLAALERQLAEREEKVSEEEIRPLRLFTSSWEPYLRPAATKDLGNHLRNALATLATRAGLTSEGATVPAEARSYSVGGKTIRTQQVSLNVIGDSLPAVLAWLGAAEAEFPYARVESLTLSAYASRSVQLAVTLLHPVEDATAAPPAEGRKP